jgi:hypothetical protein
MDKKEIEFYIKEVRALKTKALENTEKLFLILQMLP